MSIYLCKDDQESGTSIFSTIKRGTGRCKCAVYPLFLWFVYLIKNDKKL